METGHLGLEGGHYKGVKLKWPWQKPGSIISKAWSCIEFNAKAGHIYALSPFWKFNDSLKLKAFKRNK